MTVREATRPTTQALRFIVLLGVVSLAADMTYEGARSVIGPFLGVLGAGAVVVATTSGLGELAGYGLRAVSGYLSDRTGRYWAVTGVGYAVNLLAVPLLALAGRWEVAAGLIVAERIGKAVRTPARDAMLSHAAAAVGRGWGFGLHEALDQVGAVAGPLLVAAILAAGGSYRTAFAVLAVPAVVALATLRLARVSFPSPRRLEVETPSVPAGLPRGFWLYLAAAGLVAAGYADFPLVAFHVARNGLVAEAGIPALYALAMTVDALAALLVGRLFDRVGFPALAGAVAAAALFAPLVFLGALPAVLAGVALWGVGMGAQESSMRAAVAVMVGPQRRGAAFGLFHAWYGLTWFAGSALMGVLYETSPAHAAAFSLGAQAAAVPLLVAAARADGRPRRPA
ncbi:MAG: MFS transporter [Armatimonadota bacterium]|nr:MFS transporter [Armatimonadota bacterium]